MKNPFGIRDGQMIAVGDLTESEKGLNCRCTCPSCKEPFEARMGKKKRRHFAHSKNSNCNEAHAMIIGLYRFIVPLLHSCFSLPPYFLYLDYYHPSEFERKLCDQLEQSKESPFEEFQKFFKWSSDLSDTNYDDAIICYNPLGDRCDNLPPELKKMSDDGTYMALCDMVLLTFPNVTTAKTIDEYSPELGIPSSLLISGPNLPCTRIILSFDFDNPTCTSRQMMQRWKNEITASAQFDDDVPCLELCLYTGFLSNSMLTSEEIKENLKNQIFNVRNMRWQKVPPSNREKALKYMMNKYEKKLLKKLYEQKTQSINDLSKELEKFEVLQERSLVDLETGELIEFGGNKRWKKSK